MPRRMFECFTPVSSLTRLELVMLPGAKKILNYFSFGFATPSDTSKPKGEEFDLLQKTGSVSFLNEDYGVIDNYLQFSKRVVQGKIVVGDTVTYLSVKPKEDKPERVFRVAVYADLNGLKNVAEEDWLIRGSFCRSSLPIVKDLIIKKTERVVNGKVTRTIGKRIIISPLNTHCELDKIKCYFFPRVGDRVSVTSKLSRNQLNGTKMWRIVRVEPLAVRCGSGAVTLLKKNGEGVIENEIFFTDDFAPGISAGAVGTLVKYTAIYSNQGRYTWRALSVEILHTERTRENSRQLTTRFRNGIVIKGKFQFGPMQLSERAQLVLDITNTGRNERTLMHSSSARPLWGSQVELIDPKPCENILFKPGEQIKFVFRCNPRFIGISREAFEFYFGGFKVDFLFTVNVRANEDGDMN